MHVSAQPIDKLQDHARFRLNDTFHHDLAGSISDRDRNAFLVDSMPIYLVLVIKGVPFWRS
jgi:hypothetical protein